jgi:hypothetical protein
MTLTEPVEAPDGTEVTIRPAPLAVLAPVPAKAIVALVRLVPTMVTVSVAGRPEDDNLLRAGARDLHGSTSHNVVAGGGTARRRGNESLLLYWRDWHNRISSPAPRCNRRSHPSQKSRS